MSHVRDAYGWHSPIGDKAVLLAVAIPAAGLFQRYRTNGMNLMLQTDNDKTVRLADAMLLEVEDLPGAEPNRTELCAVVNVESDLTATQVDGVQALPTKLGFVVDSENAFAVLHVLCGSTLLVTALDLAEPETQALMLAGPWQGFALAIVGAAVQKVVRVPVAHLRAEIAEHGKAATRAGYESRVAFMAFMLRRIGDSEGRDSLGLHGLDFDRVLLSFVNVAASPSTTGELTGGAEGSRSLH